MQHPDAPSPDPTPPPDRTPYQQWLAGLGSGQKVAIVAVGAIAVLALVWFLAPPAPEAISLTRYKELRKARSDSSWVLVGRVHSSGKTLGASMPGAPRQEMQIDGSPLHFLRLEDPSGVRAIVWIDPAKNPVPENGSHVQLTGSFRRVPMRVMSKEGGHATIGFATTVSPADAPAP